MTTTSSALPSAERARGEFYEPWTPAIGQRVRIALNGECGLTGPAGSPAGDNGIVGHDAEEHGRLGVIRDPAILNPSMVAQGHRYLVRRSGPPINGFSAGWYAAVELVPLGQADDRADREEDDDR